MHLRRSHQVGRGRRPSREAYPPTVGRCRRQSLEWCRKSLRDAERHRLHVASCLEVSRQQKRVAPGRVLCAESGNVILRTSLYGIVVHGIIMTLARHRGSATPMNGEGPFAITIHLSTLQGRGTLAHIRRPWTLLPPTFKPFCLGCLR